MVAKAKTLANTIIITIFLGTMLVMYQTFTSHTSTIAFRAKRRSNVDWNKTFHFIPYSMQYCEEITERLPSNQRLPANLESELQQFEAVVKRRVSGKRFGGSEAFVNMQYTYNKLVKEPFVRTVCETGFNAGHSAFVWLLGKSDTKVYSFDIGVHGYGDTMAEYLQERFPGRLHVTWGNSIETLPVFRKENPDVKCDVMLIDGGHNYFACKADFDNFRQMASDDNIVIIDDYPRKSGGWLWSIGNVWEVAKRNGEISEIFNCENRKRNHGFAIAHYT